MYTLIVFAVGDKSSMAGLHFVSGSLPGRVPDVLLRQGRGQDVRVVPRPRGPHTSRARAGARTPYVACAGCIPAGDDDRGIRGLDADRDRAHARRRTASYPNLHGDVAATANGQGIKTGGTFLYDPYGQPLGGYPGNTSAEVSYAWAGKHQKMTEHQGGVATIEMGPGSMCLPSGVSCQWIPSRVAARTTMST